MRPCRIAIAFAFVSLSVAVHAQLAVRGKPALAPKSSALLQVPSLRAEAFPRGSEWSLTLPALAPAAKALTTADDKRMRVGIARDANDAATSIGAPAWISAPDGGRVAHIRVTSAGASALRVGLRVRGLPDGAQVRVAARDGSVVTTPLDAGTIDASVRLQGVFWTPVSDGETQVIELWLPPGTSAVPSVAVTMVSHLLTTPSRLFKSTGVGASQDCEENVVCVADRNPALANAANAVAKMIYTDNGVTYLCTGTLLSDGDPASQVPYLLSAAHCVSSDAAAATLNTFWFFQSASCGGKDASGYKQLAGGATLLYASASSDVALLRLHDRAPDGAWFAGWDGSALAAGTSIVTLHHPSGDVKKVSLGQALDDAAAASAGYSTAAWTAGSTEGGSSGSGLFTFDGNEYLLRGALRGGSASCASSGYLDDPSNRDYYSRLDLEAATLAKWLSTGVSPLDDYSGLWWSPDEPGSGMSIVQNAANHVFVAWFSYDAQSQPTWIVMPQATWKSAVAFEGTLYRAQGSAFGAAYDPSLFKVASVGTLRIEFASDGTARATFTVDGQTVVKTLEREPI